MEYEGCRWENEYEKSIGCRKGEAEGTESSCKKEGFGERRDERDKVLLFT